MTELDDFRERIRSAHYLFAETLAFIAANYTYTPTEFTNGSLTSTAGQNEGSCKLLGLAQLEDLSVEETLQAFGEHYRSVLNSPDGEDHGNIRALMKSGLAGVSFNSAPLTRKN